MKRKITYKDVKELGFERYEMNDSVFYDWNGYHDFYMTLLIGKFEFAWYPEKEHTQLRKFNKQQTIISSINIYSLSELKVLIKLFNTNEKDVDLNKPTSYGNEMLAC